MWNHNTDQELRLDRLLELYRERAVLTYCLVILNRNANSSMIVFIDTLYTNSLRLPENFILWYSENTIVKITKHIRCIILINEWGFRNHINLKIFNLQHCNDFPRPPHIFIKICWHNSNILIKNKLEFDTVELSIISRVDFTCSDVTCNDLRL